MRTKRRLAAYSSGVISRTVMSRRDTRLWDMPARPLEWWRMRGEDMTLPVQARSMMRRSEVMSWWKSAGEREGGWGGGVAR